MSHKCRNEEAIRETQRKAVLRHMRRFGWIDQDTALALYKIRRLAARIFEIRRFKKIKTLMIKRCGRYVPA